MSDICILRSPPPLSAPSKRYAARASEQAGARGPAGVRLRVLAHFDSQRKAALASTFNSQRIDRRGLRTGRIGGAGRCRGPDRRTINVHRETPARAGAVEKTRRASCRLCRLCAPKPLFDPFWRTRRTNTIGLIAPKLCRPRDLAQNRRIPKGRIHSRQ